MNRCVYLTIVLFAAMGPVLPLCAQATPNAKIPTPLEVTLAYSQLRSNGTAAACGCFWMQGGKVEFNLALIGNFSAVGELAGHHATDINSAHEDLSLVTYLFGGRYSYRRYRHVTPFAQVLIGGVHGFDALFPTASGSTIVPDAFALTAGGGLNIRVSRYLAIRPAQVDYLQTRLPNDAANRENSLRLGAGIVFLINPSR